MGRCVSGVLALLLIASVLALCLNVQLGRSNPATITVPNDYPTIQEAIDHANAGDTIFVKAGTYIGHIDVNKSITLKGESIQNTTLKVQMVQSFGAGIHVFASDVTISGFNISSDSRRPASILVYIDGRDVPCDNSLFAGNIIGAKDADALYVSASSGTRIEDNSVFADFTHACICLFFGDNSCVVSKNTVKGGWLGIYCSDSDSTLVSNNLVMNQVSDSGSGAITLMGAPNTTVVGNTVANNEKGIYLQRQTGDHIYSNNFINNLQQVILYNVPSVASWDNGYPLGGNYWSDYNGTDVYSGRYQNETGSDGIGDTPYAIDSGNQDNYPLMNPYWNPADVNRDMRVDIKDVLAVSRALGSCPSDPKWNPLCDVNNDLKVDIKDYYTVCKNYGKTHP